MNCFGFVGFKLFCFVFFLRMMSFFVYFFVGFIVIECILGVGYWFRRRRRGKEFLFLEDLFVVFCFGYGDGEGFRVLRGRYCGEFYTIFFI